MTDHYDTLGVDRDAGPDEIKRQFQRMRSKHHPDREGGDAETMSKVNVAYDVLSDPQRRLHYDKTGQDSAPEQERQAQEIVCGMILGFLHSNNGERDFSVWIVNAIDGEIGKASSSLAEGERLLVLNERMTQRLRFRGNGKDYVRQALVARRHDITMKIEQNRQVLERLRLARTMANDYSYEVPQEVASPLLMLGGFHVRF